MKENEMICHCKQVSYGDVEKALHQIDQFDDVLKAFEEVKPNLILTVPLILEKIYKKMILPQLSKTTMKVALNIPLLDSRIYAQIRKKLVDSFGVGMLPSAFAFK